VFAAVAALVLVAAACGNGSGRSGGASGRTLVFSAEGELKGFNPAVTRTGGQVAADVAQNILFYGSKATPTFGLDFVGLEHPPTIVSTSPQVVEYVIAKDAVWSDGTAVSSEDLRYYWEQATRPENGVDVSPSYEDMTRLEVTGPKSVRATFAEPVSYENYARYWGAVPQAAYVKAHGKWETALDDAPGPSAGPYMLDGWDKGVSLTLVRNPKWWGAKKPGLDRIIFRFRDGAKSLREALSSGEVDMAAPQADPVVLADVKDLIQAKGSQRVRVEKGASADWEVLTLNTQGLLSDVRVRRAVAMAIDRDAIAAVAVKPVVASAKPLGNFVFMPNQPTYEAHDAAYFPPDRVAAARSLLAEAGWTQSGASWTKGGKRLELTLSTTPGQTIRVEQMDLIRDQLGRVGIATTRDDCPIACLRTRMAGPGPFDITGFGWSGGVAATSTIKAIYGTGSPLNFGKWSNTRFDDLMKAAVSEPDPQRQASLANQADRLLWEDLPALPLYEKPGVLIVRDRFVGPGVNGGGDGVFWNSQEWTVKAGK
jgi:peptide/nickel transport system substrate-binding protein